MRATRPFGIPAFASALVSWVLFALFWSAPAQAQGLTITSLTPSLSYPLVAGTPVTWTTTISNASGPVEYMYVMYQRTSWVVMQNYGPSSSFTWTPQPGDEGTPNYFQVWARNVGSTAPYDAYLGTLAFDVLPAPVVLTKNVDFPTPVGNLVTWTASTSLTPTPEYEFRVLDQATSIWTVFRSYATTPQAQWTPQANGNYVVEVRARAVGNTSAYQWAADSQTLVVASTSLTVTALTTPATLPAPTGAPITWTARAQGGTAGPLEYSFWLNSIASGVWTNVQPYSTNTTYTWTPSWADAGDYSLQAWVKNAGSTAVYDAWLSTATTFQIFRTSLQLTTPTQFPTYAKMPIVWTAHLPDPIVSFEYQFWVYSSQTGQWTLGRDYSSSETFTWTPTTPGTYTIQAWARQVGSTATYEVYTGVYSLEITNPVITATPAGGAYNTAQTVSLTGPSGATIRYTTNNTTPTTSSPAYTAPIAINSSQTIRAKTFQGTWMDSYELVESYIIDTTRPMITAMYSPPANSNGWNNSPVLVSFTCTDDYDSSPSCPNQVMFSTEGAGQSITVSSTDAAGNVANLVVTVNLDMAAPIVSLTSPSVVSTTTSPIAISASVNEALSGISSSSCNGVSASISNGAVTCSVGVSKGPNEVVVQVMDVAGNVASVAAHVTLTGMATALSITPSRYTLVSSDTALPLVMDDYGQPATVTWTTSDPTIATIDTDGVLTANAPGQAILTATSGSLSAQANVTVVAGTELPVGAAAWIIDPLPQHTLKAVTVGPTDDSTIFATVERQDAAPTLIRGFNSAGQQTRLMTAPIAATEQMAAVLGDVNGSVLLSNQTSLVYVATSSGHSSWRFTAPTDVRLSSVALAPDGTLFALGRYQAGPGQPPPAPYTAPIQQAYVFGIDSQSGLAKFRVVLPQSRILHRELCVPFTSYNNSTSVNGAGSIAIDTAGRANIAINEEDIDESFVGTSPTCQLQTNSYTGRALLYRISSEGATEVTILHDYSGDLNARLSQPFPPLPDDQGGVLATWECVGSSCGGVHSRLVGANSAGEFAASILPLLSGSGQVGYGVPFDGSNQTFAMNLATGGSVALGPGFPIASLMNGAVYVSAPDGSASITGSDGSVLASGLPAVTPVLSFGDAVLDLVHGSPATVVTGTSVAFDINGGAPFLGSTNQRIQFYTSIDDAVMAAFKVFLPRTKASNREHGSRICQTRGGYGWSPDIKLGRRLPNGAQATDLHIGVEECGAPFGTTKAYFHTHPFRADDLVTAPSGYSSQASYNGAAGPNSGSDLKTADLFPTYPFYLGARNSPTWPNRPNPPTSETHVLKYQGPLSAHTLFEWDDTQKRWLNFPDAPW